MADDPYKYFRVEARELAEELTRAVLDLEKGAPPEQATARLLRNAHTLKGAARVVKQPEIADHAHGIEDALEPFRDATTPVSADCLQVILTLIDAIGDRIEQLPSPGAPVRGQEAAPPVVPAEAPVRTMIRAEVAEMDVLLEGVGEAHARLAALQKGLGQVEQARELAALLLSQLATPRVFEAGLLDGAEQVKRVRRSATELVDSVVTFEQGLRADVEHLDRELGDIRVAVERLRLVPARALFIELERATRDVAEAQSKLVVFEGRGGDQRLDAHLLSAAQGALQQIVRNAVAHGIETEIERRALGKVPAGRVTVEIARRGRSAVFICRDDGRGIDLDAVRDAAVRKGLRGDDAAAVSPSEVMRLLLKGGLSTTGTVTELSGRGIGLDVVRDFVTRFGGEIIVTTETGQGTTVEIHVPLALASFDAITVESDGVVALIPLDSVSRVLRVAPDDILVNSQGVTVIHDGQAVPFVQLSELLDAKVTHAAGGRTAGPVLVVSAALGVAAVGVQRLLGTSNIVARPLPSSVGHSRLVSSVWLDAEGNPQLVLDPTGIVAQSEGEARRVVADDDDVPLDPILVIDDSLTTRMLERSILESGGYPVELASSAEEGLIKARTKSYLLFLVDVEMPGIDGFTFVERTRADPVLRDIPAILVSSRNAPEDIQRGYDAGASGYVTKGDFNQGKLLARIKELTVR